MKKIIAGLLLLTSLCSFKKDKKEQEPAFKKGDITAIVAYGTQIMFWESLYTASSNVTACAEYQLSNKFNVGLQYSYNYTETKWYRNSYRVNGVVTMNTPTYQQKQWSWGNILLLTGEYCFVNKGRTSISSGLGIGIFAGKRKEHTIDSMGIPSYSTSPVARLAVQLQLVNAKMRLSENWGLYGGLGLGYRGILSLGAHYTFNKHKN